MKVRLYKFDFFNYIFAHFCLLIMINTNLTCCRRMLHLDATLSLLEAELEGTRPYKEFENNDSKGIEESTSSLLVPTNSASNDRVVDAPFEYGESSG